MITAGGFVILAGLGAVGRAALGRHWNGHFPFGTVAVNVVGSFALGLLVGSDSAVVTAIGVGGLGALTTFSSFARDTVALIEENRFVAAAVYVGSTITLGLTAAAGGLALT